MRQKVEKKKRYNFRYKHDTFENDIQVVNKNNHEISEFDYYIGRPSILSNIYSHRPNTTAKYVVNSRTEAIDSYILYFEDMLINNEKFLKELEYLLNFFKKNNKLYLVCYCKPKRCHGDVIKDYLIKRLRE